MAEITLDDNKVITIDDNGQTELPTAEPKKPPQPKLKSFKNDVIIKKPSIGKELSAVIKDTLKGVWTEIIVPNGKRMLFEGLNGGMNYITSKIIYKVSGGTINPNMYKNNNYYYNDYYGNNLTNYTQCYYGNSYYPKQKAAAPSAAAVNQAKPLLPELFFEDGPQYHVSAAERADGVLQDIMAALEEYTTISVTTVYEAAGITIDYTWDKYGWSREPGKDLAGARKVKVPNGWLLQLPQPHPLDD